MAGAQIGDRAMPDLDADGRPTLPLPVSQLLRLSLYWLGLSSTSPASAAILGGRLQFEHLVAPNTEGVALLEMTALGALVAAVVQPTVWALSDPTR